MPLSTSVHSALATAWTGLRLRLEGRLKVLNDEISHYPGPIARCDQHLAALIEQRSALFARLQRMDVLAPLVSEIDALLAADIELAASAELESS